MINGITVIYKEPGFTSHDVVAKLRGICGQKKIGHTGTLDPMATGVLPVCLGSATKVCDMLTDRDKEYVAELLLGVETDTQDTTGQILTQRPVVSSKIQIQEAFASFLGDYDQVPPMYSALKVNGKKLYELARAGKEVERRSRRVVIKELEILKCDIPVIRFRVVCSKGTYIRTLCADIGEKLGCGGVMQKLERTRVGSFTLQDAQTLKEMQKLREEGRLEEAVVPVDSVFMDCPLLHIRRDYCKLVDNGNAFYPNQAVEGESHAPGKWVRVYRADESFVGIYALEAERKRYEPVKMFLEKA